MIYATGDLHGNSLRFQPQYFPEQSEMTKDDYMIVCGDFGCVWNGDKSDDPQLDRLEALPFTVLFVDGNHENFDALNEHPLEQWHGGRVNKIRPHVIHLMRGQAFELQGCTFFTMGGAQSHDIGDGILDMDSPDFYEQYDSLRRNRGQFRIDHISWWQEELPSGEEYAEARQPSSVLCFRKYALTAFMVACWDSSPSSFFVSFSTARSSSALIPPIPTERILSSSFEISAYSP